MIAALASRIILAASLLATSCSGDDGGVVVDTAGGDGPGGACGNGQLDEGEECDGGDDCTSMCTVPRCGDGLLAADEECDDANEEDGDACTSACALGPEAIVDLAVGEAHTCVVSLEGRVKCWGAPGDGRLGQPSYDESIGDDEPPSDWDDVVVYDLPIDEVSDNVVALAAGLDHTCAILEFGGAICWGANGSRQLGYPHSDDVGDDETPFAAGELALDGSVTMIAGGESHACALLAGGDVTCWGGNGSGQLGYGNTTSSGDMDAAGSFGPVDLPAGTVSKIVAGQNHTCSLSQIGDVVCWGRNAEGQLGTGMPDNVGDDETPASVGSIDVGGWVNDIDAFWNNTCAVLANGKVVCWGSNTSGQLGNGGDDNVGDRKTPAEEGNVMFDGGAVSVEVGQNFACALTAEGAAHCWGHNSNVGYPDADNRALPGPAVALGASIVKMRAGVDHTCAITSTGGVRCWGENNGSLIGNPEVGSTENVTKPSQYGDVDVF